MRRNHVRNRFARLLPILAVPVEASAQQTAGSDAVPVTSSAASWGGVAALIAVLVVLIIVIGGTAKLYDAKRKRKGDALMLQARISDALLRDFVTLPITAVAAGSMWRRTPLVLMIKGSVPTPEQRDAVMRVVGEELSRHPGVRAQDWLVVDPMVGRQRVSS